MSKLPGGTSFIDLCRVTLQSAMEEGPFPSISDRDVQYTVRNLKASSETLAFEVVRGATGILSDIEGETEADRFKRKEHHRENISLRVLALFPEKGRHAFLLAERVGSIGVASFVNRLLVDTIRPRVDATLAIEPLATAADLTSADVSLSGITFQLPHPSDKAGAREGVDGFGGRFNLKWTFRGKKKVKQFTDSSGKKIDPLKVFGVLSGALDGLGMEISAERAQELKVQATMTMDVAGSNRSFTLGSDEGPALVYAIDHDDSGKSYSSWPSLKAFQATCVKIVTDLDGKFDVTKKTQTLVSMTRATPAAPEQKWKVVWNEPGDEVAS